MLQGRKWGRAPGMPHAANRQRGTSSFYSPAGWLAGAQEECGLHSMRYVVPSTGACLTLGNAQLLLNNYVTKLPGDRSVAWARARDKFALAQN